MKFNTHATHFSPHTFNTQIIGPSVWLCGVRAGAGRVGCAVRRVYQCPVLGSWCCGRVFDRGKEWKCNETSVQYLLSLAWHYVFQASTTMSTATLFSQSLCSLLNPSSLQWNIHTTPTQTVYNEQFAPQLDDLLRAVLFGLYGSFNEPADETAIVRVLETLMTQQLEAQESRPDNFLRKSSLFSKYENGRRIDDYLAPPWSE